jgi:hypothetical protein
MPKRVAVQVPRRKSLATYIEEHPRSTGGVKCWLCSLPEVEEVNAAYRTGKASIPSIVRWLADQEQGPGYSEATYSKVKGHFVSYRHHEKPARA